MLAAAVGVVGVEAEVGNLLVVAVVGADGFEEENWAGWKAGT